MGGAAPDTIIGRADAERERVPTAPQVRKRVDRGPAREPPQDARC